ncbi:hypothetical protein Y032_0002g930 [Ancylostoma ceylanicum]|uniref:Uncharacterized protein n=1 Tax=Ancylostoma ceylanicum TaxID=53326 RepID=A0A016W271_9BILA|nr:hypothetical protein Y032_0002g930 [Ancylostoma ceylanicum]
MPNVMGSLPLLLCFVTFMEPMASGGSLEEKWLENCGSYPYVYENACHQFARWDIEARVKNSFFITVLD